MPEPNRGRSQAQHTGGMRSPGNTGGPQGRGPGGSGGGGHTPGGGRDGASPRIAVPWYVGGDFQEAPPGHRYLLYLPFWKEEWSAVKEGKQKELRKLGIVPSHATEVMHALAERQRAIGAACGDEVIEAVSISPFATGLGWEHPNENGFAFLHPYGLPYLAASGVKGVLRDVARELADGLNGEAHGWTEYAVAKLFGPMPEEIKKPEDARRGALRFFDVIPEIVADKENKIRMDVDIMNPHYGEYYQGNSTPHDAGSPVPIFFLVVPPKSKFTFVVDCPREHLLSDELRGTWRAMIRAAFAHAFDWLGFGAKTAVGYGAMRRLTEKEKAEQKQQEADQAAAATRCQWVDEKLVELAKKNNIPESKLGDVLRGKALAEAWAALTDADLKKRALDDIRSRWQKEEWWDRPPGKAAKQAKGIYEGTA